MEGKRTWTKHLNCPGSCPRFQSPCQHSEWVLAGRILKDRKMKDLCFKIQSLTEEGVRLCSEVLSLGANTEKRVEGILYGADTEKTKARRLGVRNIFMESLSLGSKHRNREAAEALFAGGFLQLLSFVHLLLSRPFLKPFIGHTWARVRSKLPDGWNKLFPVSHTASLHKEKQSDPLWLEEQLH